MNDATSHVPPGHLLEQSTLAPGATKGKRARIDPAHGASALLQFPCEMAVPAQVIIATMKSLAFKEKGAVEQQVDDTASTSPMMEVEVETTQGYVYRGRLESLDGYYNVSLRHAMVWRQRDVDYSRAAVSQRLQQEAQQPNPFPQPQTYGAHPSSTFLCGGEGAEGGGARGEEGSDAAEIAMHMAKRRYVGSVYIRSCNVLLCRMLSHTAELKSHFRAMTVKVRQFLQAEKQRNRDERRKRREENVRAASGAPRQPAKAPKGKQRPGIKRSRS